MRLRNVVGSKEYISQNEFVVQDPEKIKGNWNLLFKNNNPIFVEIGMGKGKFLRTLAEMNPNINYIGIEKYSSVLLRAIQKRSSLKTGNLLFIRMDAVNICEVFDKNEISGIYLNFSDPWPKDRHAKRRLTSSTFLTKYDEFLIPNGKVVFKTDNRDLFHFSLEQIPKAGWRILNYTNDLHNSDGKEENIMTEYEEKFLASGLPIYQITSYRIP